MARVRFLASIMAAYLFEGLAAWFFFQRTANSDFIYAALVCHLLASASFILFTTAKPRSLPGIAYYYPRLLALFSFFMPLIGLVGVTLTMLMALVFMESHGLAEEYKEKSYVSSGIEVDLPDDVTEFLYEEVDVHPIADILAGDDMGMKRGAVNLLRRIGSAEAVKLLRKSLSDENAEVRFYAHTALTRLEEDYAEALEKARFRVERYDSAQAHAELASTHRNYARSGLPEVNMQEQSMLQSCDHWKVATEKDPENMDYVMRLAEVYTESRKFVAAIDIYRRMVKIPEYELEARLGICRSFFEQGNYIALFIEVEKIREKPDLDTTDPFKKSIYNFWAHVPVMPEEPEDLVLDEVAYD